MSNIFLSTRPPVTAYEAEKLRSLSKFVQQSDVDMFEIHGYISQSTAQNHTLIYTIDQGGKLGASVLPLGNMDTKSLSELYESIDRAAPVVGGGTRCEVNPRTLPRDRFSLNFNPLELENVVLPAISAFCKTGVEAKLYSLSVMTKGDCFGTTTSTDHEERRDYVGSLVIGIPTVIDGGELFLAKDDRKSTIKISAKAEEQEPPASFWAFIPLGVESRVQPIASGYRLTLNYKVFATGAVLYKGPTKQGWVDVKGLELYRHLEDLFQDEDFLWSGGYVAIPCQYEYPTLELKSWSASDLGSILKGSDYLLWNASGAVGYSRSMAVARKLSVGFDLSDTFWIEDKTLKTIRASGSKVYPVDAFSSYNPNLGIAHPTSNSLRGPPSHTLLEKGWKTDFQILGEECDSMLEMQLIWAAAPTVWFKDGTVLQEGESTCSIVQSYVSAVIVLEVPVSSD
ncbi:hypothetical protein FRC04_003172 [Tulasnella sp. 424]|nr:hypothetical protein FRC04_003172 [Tulasnella sp. 424]KAG8966281.1 hypothetical protein FRC05_002740 [Tulasnella sp. 425]